MQDRETMQDGWSWPVGHSASRRSADAARRSEAARCAAYVKATEPSPWSSASHEPSGRHASIPYNVVGPAHRLYLRKAEGRRRLTAGATRPQLNTDDLETRLRFVDIDELLEEEGHDEEAAGRQVTLSLRGVV